jgi:hypothetical protein
MAATRHGLSVGSAVGVTFTVTLVVVALGLLGVFYFYRMRKRAVVVDQPVIRATPETGYVGDKRNDMIVNELGPGLRHEMQGN